MANLVQTHHVKNMVNHGYPWLATDIHGKTKKYHNSTQNCPFPMIFGPKWPKFHGDSFPDVKRPKFLYIWWVFATFFFFDIKKKTFFQRSKIRTTFGVPKASRPTHVLMTLQTLPKTLGDQKLNKKTTQTMWTRNGLESVSWKIWLWRKKTCASSK